MTYSHGWQKTLVLLDENIEETVTQQLTSYSPRLEMSYRKTTRF